MNDREEETLHAFMKHALLDADRPDYARLKDISDDGLYTLYWRIAQWMEAQDLLSYGAPREAVLTSIDQLITRFKDIPPTQFGKGEVTIAAKSNADKCGDANEGLHVQRFRTYADPYGINGEYKQWERNPLGFNDRPSIPTLNHFIRRGDGWATTDEMQTTLQIKHYKVKLLIEEARQQKFEELVRCHLAETDDKADAETKAARWVSEHYIHRKESAKRLAYLVNRGEAQEHVIRLAQQHYPMEMAKACTLADLIRRHQLDPYSARDIANTLLERKIAARMKDTDCSKSEAEADARQTYLLREDKGNARHYRFTAEAERDFAQIVAERRKKRMEPSPDSERKSRPHLTDMTHRCRIRMSAAQRIAATIFREKILSIMHMTGCGWDEAENHAVTNYMWRSNNDADGHRFSPEAEQDFIRSADRLRDQRAERESKPTLTEMSRRCGLNDEQGRLILLDIRKRKTLAHMHIEQCGWDDAEAHVTQNYIERAHPSYRFSPEAEKDFIEHALARYGKRALFGIKQQGSAETRSR